MRQKIEAAIVLISFGALAAVHVAIIPALVAFEMTGDSTVGFWAYVASVPVLILPLSFLMVWLAAYANDRLVEQGEWVTVKSQGGETKRVKIAPRVYRRGKRDHELEQQIGEG